MIFDYVLLTVIAVIFLVMFVLKDRRCDAMMAENFRLLNDSSGQKQTPEELENLNKDLVKMALKHYGILAQESSERGDRLTFKWQGEQFHVCMENMPLFFIRESYTFTPKDYDLELMHRAAAEVTGNLILGKVRIFQDEVEGEAIYTLDFSISSVETTYGHLRDSIMQYLMLLDELHTAFGNKYDELKGEKQDKVLMS